MHVCESTVNVKSKQGGTASWLCNAPQHAGCPNRTVWSLCAFHVEFWAVNVANGSATPGFWIMCAAHDAVMTGSTDSSNPCMSDMAPGAGCSAKPPSSAAMGDVKMSKDLRGSTWS